MLWRMVFALFLVAASSLRVSGQTQNDVPWEQCPCDGQLGTLASVSIPEGFSFVGRNGVGKFMELTQNPSFGDELGVILKLDDNKDFWFVVFSFHETGYVKDDEKDNLDTEAILDSIRRGTEEANKVRAEKGWAPLHIVGWERKPFYDADTNNLTWATKATSEGEESLNYSVRLLGRRGVMNAELVVSPHQLPAAVPQFNQILRGFGYTPGGRYTEFRPGDKVASYGLTALVAGGVGAAAAKSGLLGKLWKFLAFGLLALAACVKKLISAVFGRRDATEQTTPTA